LFPRAPAVEDCGRPIGHLDRVLPERCRDRSRHERVADRHTETTRPAAREAATIPRVSRSRSVRARQSGAYHPSTTRRGGEGGKVAGTILKFIRSMTKCQTRSHNHRLPITPSPRRHGNPCRRSSTKRQAGYLRGEGRGHQRPGLVPSREDHERPDLFPPPGRSHRGESRMERYPGAPRGRAAPARARGASDAWYRREKEYRRNHVMSATARRSARPRAR